MTRCPKCNGVMQFRRPIKKEDGNYTEYYCLPCKKFKLIKHKVSRPVPFYYEPNDPYAPNKF